MVPEGLLVCDLELAGTLDDILNLNRLDVAHPPCFRAIAGSKDLQASMRYIGNVFLGHLAC